MNIQQEICKVYNQTKTQNLSSVKYFNGKWYNLLDSLFYSSLIFLTPIDGPLIGFFILFLIFWVLTYAYDQILNRDYYPITGPCSYIIALFKKKKKIKSVVISPSSLIKPNIYSEAFSFYTQKLINDYQFTIETIDKKINVTKHNLEFLQKNEDTPAFSTKTDIIVSLKDKLNEHILIFEEQLQSAIQAQSELEAELNSISKQMKVNEQLYSLASAYNLTLTNEQDIYLYNQCLERLSMLKNEIMIKVNSEKELQTISLKSLE